MRKALFGLLLLVGGAAFAFNGFAAVVGDPNEDVGLKLQNALDAKEKMRRSPGLGTFDVSDPETVYVGHVTTGGYGPYKVGRGPYLLTQGPSNTPNPASNWDGVWGWDNYQVGENDSLMGWWPVKRPQRQTIGLLNFPNDKTRSWFGLDHGNQVNYRSNALSGGVPRTFGITGMWHVSGGTAWCGLNEAGDVSEVDPVTGNPYNAQAIQFNNYSGPSGSTIVALPGYVEQIDQMLFRDWTPAAATPVTVSFTYTTNMSTGADLDPVTMHGWYNFDPLKAPTLNDGNWISATDAGNIPPRDSFMVYIGVPVDDAACTYSNGDVNPVYDPLRRWFSEVIRIDQPFYQLLSVAGDNSAAPSFAVSGTIIDELKAAGNGKVRLVFRVKTNRGFDDGDGAATGYTSGGLGAARVDAASVTGSGGFSVGFDAGDINNTSDTDVAFHSTGKPTFAMWHVANLATLVYNELCGPPSSPSRSCNIYNNVISCGDADNAQAAGGVYGTGEQEQAQGAVSPTLNLVNDGVGMYNGIGLDEEIVTRDEINSMYDIYAGRHNVTFSGNTWQYGAQSYPSTRVGVDEPQWGPINIPGFQYFNPDPQCFATFEYNVSEGLVTWADSLSASPDHPDSIRIFWGHNQICFRFNVSAGCSPTTGMYLDNSAVAFTNTPAAVASNGPRGTDAVTAPAVAIWYVFHDAFPANAAAGLPGTAAFDTTSAHIKVGINNAPSTGLTRPSIPADSAIITGAGASATLFFSIKPGPGNYANPNNLAAGLKQVPTAATLATPGDGSFWGSYMDDAANAAAHAAAPGGWDKDVWNSARMDTAEVNRFPVIGKGITSLTIGTYASIYHDSDANGGADPDLDGNLSNVASPRAAARGLMHRCFLVDPLGANNSGNITCTSVPSWVTADPSVTGYDGNASTYEYVKILEDGQFTPGTHVRYYFQAGDGSTTPQLTVVTPQPGESSTDGHRWQQFGVLPDRWKSFEQGADACMLFVDNNDRRGNERVWVSVADSIGATAPNQWGAHNGWHALGGGADINDPAQNRLPPSQGGGPGFRQDNGGQPGTSWDMFGIKASESLTTSAGGFGSRLGPAAVGFLVGQESRIGPTPEMLQAYYPMLLWLSGDLNSGVLGPFNNRMSNDVLMLTDYLSSATLAEPRGIFVMGDGFVESATNTGGAQLTLLTNFLGLSLRSPSYVSLSSNLNACADLLPTSPLSTTDIYGSGNACLWSNDTYSLSAEPTAAADLFYQNVGGSGPYIAGVRTGTSGSKFFITQADGLEIEHVYSRFCEGSLGRLAHMRNVLVTLFGSLCALSGSPVGIGDDPHAISGSDYLRLASRNPYESGSAKIAFGITKSGKVEVGIFDVAGRQVRVLANQVFAPGKYELTWDGLDAGGNSVAKGVYFYRLKSPFFNSANKVIVLK
jgi:hypothetical protein